MNSTQNYAIELCNITKIFSGVIANDHITIQLRKGEIHALLGENGAGKSTLMSVLFGLYQAEEGIIKVKGKEVAIHHPRDAYRLGIGMVHQHFKLVPTFTVLENVILGVEEVAYGCLIMEKAKKRIQALSDRYCLNIDLDARISEVSVGMQQRIEILKMLYRNNEILIFDEPTAVLTPEEIDELMAIMKRLVKEGKSILFITHKLNEIKAVADRCTILRKGKHIETLEVQTTTKEAMSRSMMGRSIDIQTPKKATVSQDVLLACQDVCVCDEKRHTVVHHVNMEIHAGELVCIAGIDGNGQTELLHALSGMVALATGSIQLAGEDITNDSIRERSKKGISYIPEDRHRHGLVLDYSLSYNMILKNYFQSPFSHRGILCENTIAAHCETLLKQYDVRCALGGETIVRHMSGGNQQKAIIAREIAHEPKVLLALQPTRGLDIGAIAYVHRQLVTEREKGRAIVLVSFELDEIMRLADRIFVMFEGAFVAELDPKKTSMEEIGQYMAGSKRSFI